MNGSEVCNKYKLKLDITKWNQKNFWLLKPQGIRSYNLEYLTIPC